MAALPRRWDELAWTDFARLPRDAVAILPVAAIEQHGPHLPLRVDAALAEAILARALEIAPAGMPLLALPLQAVGHSPEHARFPGTLALRAETALALWEDIGASVARAGLRKLVVFNSHGGQPQLVDVLCTRLRAAHGMFAPTPPRRRCPRPSAAGASMPARSRRR
jgi:creatinine amidohydrolase